MANLKFTAFTAPTDGLRRRIELLVPTEDVENQMANLRRSFPNAQITTESGIFLGSMIVLDNPEHDIINVDSTPEVTRIIIDTEEEQSLKRFFAWRARLALGE